jgi:urease accessory protein
MRKVRFHPVLGLLVAFAFAPLAAMAHAGHGDIAGLGDGILHVTSGIDHMLAAVAIGIWSMAYPWRRAWLLPLAFVGAMTAAAWAGVGHARFDTAELMIVASLIVLGVMIMRAHAFSVAGAVAICLVFGAFHGYAHGTEAGASGDYAAYVGGLAIATALLHLAGMGLGLMLRISSRYGLRVAGALVAAAGLWFAVGLAA